VTTLRIGTRGSALALWQARTVASLLAVRGVTTEIITYKTAGDRRQDAPIDEASTKGLFVKEIEEALLDGAIDLAVHSAKDMPAVAPEGLTIAAVLPREDPRDALVLPRSGADAGDPIAMTLDAAAMALGASPSIGTSSIRRSAQLASLWTGARFLPVRGNVDTRLRKLDGGAFDALVLAAAGLKRLGFGSRITLAIDIDRCVPAPGQGIVAIETRVDVPAGIREINDAAADASFRAERALVAALGGGCQLPLGAIATHGRGTLEMQAVVVSPDGARRVRTALSGDPAAPEELGRAVATALERGGATAILDDVR
jgi:hydroxymethylbilane synthase